MDANPSTHPLVRRVRHSDALDHAVRLGLLSYGLVHLLIAWLAVRLALGSGAGAASSTGALHELAQKPFGAVLLVVVGVGFVVLVVWQLLEAWAGHRARKGAARAVHRVVSVGKAVVYLALGISALRIATGSGSGGGGTDTLTARLMSLPWGVALVAVVGLVVVTVGVVHAHRGATQGFRENLDREGRRGADGGVYVALGTVGYVTKGVALLLIGGLFVYAGLTHDPDKSGGLDVALKTVLHEPFGAPMLLAIGAGLACFGLYCFAWARHLDR